MIECKEILGIAHSEAIYAPERISFGRISPGDALWVPDEGAPFDYNAFQGVIMGLRPTKRDQDAEMKKQLAGGSACPT
jgi:hypothetical protein